MAWRCRFLTARRARTAASSPRNDLVKNYRVHPTHWLISTQVDVSESFTYIARGAIYLVTDKLRDIRIKFGFVVEGRERDELPEALITAVDVHQFDWRACVDGLVADAPSDDDEA